MIDLTPHNNPIRCHTVWCIVTYYSALQCYFVYCFANHHCLHDMLTSHWICTSPHKALWKSLSEGFLPSLYVRSHQPLIPVLSCPVPSRPILLDSLKQYAGLIGGIAAACFVVVVLCVLVLYMRMCKKKSQPLASSADAVPVSATVPTPLMGLHGQI